MKGPGIFDGLIEPDAAGSAAADIAGARFDKRHRSGGSGFSKEQGSERRRRFPSVGGGASFGGELSMLWAPSTPSGPTSRTPEQWADGSLGGDSIRAGACHHPNPYRDRNRDRNRYRNRLGSRRTPTLLLAPGILVRPADSTLRPCGRGPLSDFRSRLRPTPFRLPVRPGSRRIPAPIPVRSQSNAAGRHQRSFRCLRLC